MKNNLLIKSKNKRKISYKTKKKKKKKKYFKNIQKISLKYHQIYTKK